MNTLFLVAAVLEGLVAVVFVLVPGRFFGPLGLHLDEAAVLLARLFASALLALVVLLWRARASTDAQLRQVAVRGLFAYFLVSTVVLAVAQVGGLMNALGWALVAVHVAVAIWSGTFLGK
jgi:hypothetical protein